MQTHPNDLTVSHLALDLDPQSGDIPFAPVVKSADLSLTSGALEKAVAAVLRMTREKQPVDVELESASFTEKGADIHISAGLNRFLKAKATAEVSISAENDQRVTVALSDLRTLGKIPIDSIAGPLIEKALATAAAIPGISLDPREKRGLLIEPNALLAHFDIPLTFAGGAWTIATDAKELTVKYG